MTKGKRIRVIFAASVGLLTLICMYDVHNYLIEHQDAIVSGKRLGYIISTISMAGIIYSLTYILFKALVVKRVKKEPRASEHVQCDIVESYNKIQHLQNEAGAVKKYFVSLEPQCDYGDGIKAIMSLRYDVDYKEDHGLEHTVGEVLKVYAELKENIKKSNIHTSLTYEQGATFAFKWLRGYYDELFPDNILPTATLKESGELIRFADDYYLTKYPGASCEQGALDTFEAVLGFSRTFPLLIHSEDIPSLKEHERVEKRMRRQHIDSEPFERGVADTVAWLLGKGPAPE
jgi:hypothetical protein